VPDRPLDILAQQIVAACVAETWDEGALHEAFQRAWPYRRLERAEFDEVVRLHTQGRAALLHRDGVNDRLRATKRASITALTSGGAIPDTGQYRVVLEPEGTLVGSLDEDFAVEANGGDVFQLGNASWQILRVEPGVVRVADARGAPPTIPFWLGEGPARTDELAAAVGRVREQGRDTRWLIEEAGVAPAAATQLAEYLDEGARALGAVPTPECVVLERFFDESGGMQLVVHAPFGSRINRAWGLALRKRFCRGFGFELQAAANEEAIVISLGPQHSFPLEDVFQFLHVDVARDLLVQALLDAPMFGTRWRWNLTRSLLVSRTQGGGKRVPTPLIRMRAEDELVRAFPSALACPETMPPGDLPVPWEHPLVRQTIEDCLHEAMDVEGFLEVLRGLRDGRIHRHAVDTREPSAFARGILNVMPYGFLDDAPLEERRTQAVSARRGLDPEIADTLGALDPDAVARVREQAWPEPESEEETHEALLWMGYVTEAEAEDSGWMEWIASLRAGGRVAPFESLEGPAWRAVETALDPVALVRGRMEALGPVVVLGADGAPPRAPRGEERMRAIPFLPHEVEAALLQLEVEGSVLRCRIEGRRAFCDRRLLARIHRDTLEKLRREIEPVTAAEFWRFLTCWQHAADGHHLEGPRGVIGVVRQLAGFEIAAAEWEASVLPSRIQGYRQEWLDQVTLSGEIAWGRLWGGGRSPIRTTPICLVPREDLDPWLALASGIAPPEPAPAGEPSLGENGASMEPARSSYAEVLLELLDRSGATFTRDLERRSGMLPSHVAMGLAELIAAGAITCDSFGGIRRLVTPPSKRRGVMKHAPFTPSGRWSRLRETRENSTGPVDSTLVEFAATQLLARYGVVFRRVLDRERIPVPWRDLVRVYRLRELRGHVRGGRFVQRFAGEQYALPEAVDLMRRLRRERADRGKGLVVSAADPLNLDGILTPEPRVPAQARRQVLVA
jgi:ATP-dependent Lhr-like helicase